ncbi:NADPH-dependent FMN reductase [Actinokineospora sp. G85]|uniref:NADPH-dependent FMN reductase n=1 Tax=Actinokineospora sp. G85 TaxID=3406626 RepID=UPI003C73ED69
MTRLAVIIGSTRPGRRSDQVAHWVKDAVDKRAEVTAELVDIAEFGLPLLDEPVPAMFGDYRNAHTRAWAEKIASFDGFVFVTPEYNHSSPAALKNAIDYLFAEWNDKAAGFVSFGANGGVRAVEHLRLTLAEVKVAGVRSQVALSLFTDFEISDPTAPGTFAPGEHQAEGLEAMLDEVVSWSAALKPLRTAAVQAA